MGSKKANTMQKLDFRIKLLSGNNVVLVEADGFDSEIFMPEILNGRITFQNIIPNRRCCSINQKKNARVVGMTNNDLTDRKPVLPVNNKTWRLPPGQEPTTLPLAYSTPTSGLPSSGPYLAAQNLASVKVENDKENNLRNRFERRSNEPSSQSSNILQTPEIARCTVPSPHQVVKDTLVQIPQGIKIIRLYRNQTPGAPKRAGRVVNLNSELNNYQPATNSTKHNVTPNSELSSFNVPLTPELTPGRLLRKSTALYTTDTPLRSQARTPGSVTKWRKCITPVRTYARRTNSVLQKRHSGKKMHNKKIKPSYMANTTETIKPSLKLEVRKRKLVVDPKTSISPQTFKKQQTQPDGIINLKRETKSQSQLPKSRKQYEQSKLSAFDLLTKSSRGPNISANLSEQFRKGCINKSSSTYPKYKLLCNIPPLEADDELHAIRRKKQEESAADLQHVKRCREVLNDVNVAMAEKAVSHILQKPVTINVKSNGRK